MAQAVADELSVPTAQICEVLGISRSAYYAWRQPPETIGQQNDAVLGTRVTEIFREHRRRYGSRRIVATLADEGHACSRRRVARLMKSQGLRAIQPKSFKPRSTESRHRLGYNPNLLLTEEAITRVGQVWVGDITYVPSADCGFLYLAMLMDVYSRRIVGWHLSDDMTEELVLQALRNSIAACQPSAGLIHHTDRGGQYAGREYRQTLQRAGMRQSMSRPDNCYDNAFMESCFGTIKTELEMTEYNSSREAWREIAEYIEYYNFRRKHSALDYLTPIQFESSQ
ncbi:MAG: IS3 family transposase [Aureliella sp.]